MPLTSKNNGPDLQVGDVVRMEWVVARIFSSLDVVLVARPASALVGVSAGPPAMLRSQLGTRKSALAGPVVLGSTVLLLWTVQQVHPESASVVVRRDGIEHTANGLVPVTLTTGALAADLERVDPTTLREAVRPNRPFSLEDSPVTPDADMLPYGYEPFTVAGAPAPPVAPVLTGLTPTEAQLGTPSFTLHVEGTGFKATDVIVFAGQDEPTTRVSATELTTGVNMAVWLGPDALPVYVRSAEGLISNALTFTFTPAAVTQAAPEPEAEACGEPA